MKLEQLIVQYLFLNKKVQLQEIGTFAVLGQTIASSDTEGGVTGENIIEFIYDKNAGNDEGLIDFIIKNTGKIRPLAAADLESYLMLNRQFLHIGKPLVLEGLGTLQKKQTGELGFVQGGGVQFADNQPPVVITEKLAEQVSFASPSSRKKRSPAIPVILILLLLGAAGYAAWKYFGEKPETPVVIDTAADTTAAAPARIDTTAAVLVAKDTNSFYIVIKTYPSMAAAEKGFAKLRSYGNNVVLQTVDSANIKLRMPFTLSLADTLRIKDSLSRFFGSKTFVELP